MNFSLFRWYNDRIARVLVAPWRHFPTTGNARCAVVSNSIICTNDIPAKSTPLTTIYILIDPETKKVRYVGQTVRPLEERLRDHLKDKNKNHRTCWIRSLKNRGLTPSIHLVENVIGNNWQEREQYWIAYYRSIGAPLVNGTDGGDGRNGSVQSEEERTKKSISLKGRIVSDETCKNISKSLTGKIMPDKTRAKIRDKLKLLWDDPNYRNRIIPALKAKTGTVEFRRKLSDGKKRLWADPAYRAKQTAARMGRVCSEETKKKMSAVWDIPENRAKYTALRVGRAQTAETRAKRSAAIKAKRHDPEYRATQMKARSK